MRISGNVTLSLVAEERAFLINLLKDLKAENELEERIIKRTLMGLLRKQRHRYPLYPDKECPVCERTFAAKIFERHHFACKQKEKSLRVDFDPEILERI